MKNPLPPKDSPIIAVMGLTGSGKSHFIAQLTGDMSITGDSLEPVTEEVALYSAEVDGLKVILLDTPGTDDDHRTDSVILQEIAEFLATAYTEKIQLSGVIYMHDISQERMPSSSIASLDIFKAVCGEGFHKNMCFVSNRWDKVLEEAGRKKLNQLENDKYWGKPLKGGARHVMFNGGATDATSIVSAIMKNEAATPALSKQMVDDKQRLVETPAGKIAEGELLKKINELETKVAQQQELLMKMVDATNNGDSEDLKKLVKELQEELERRKNDLGKLRSFNLNHVAAIVGAMGLTGGALMLGGPIAAGIVAVASAVTITWNFATGKF